MFSFGFQNKAMVISTADVFQLNCSNVEELRHLIIQLLQNPSKRIVLDFSGVEMIDESALHVLDRLYKLSNEHGVALEIINIEKKVRENLESQPCSFAYLFTSGHTIQLNKQKILAGKQN